MVTQTRPFVRARDIAKEVGLSQPTVSLVLNDRWQRHGISQTTRDKVVSAAQTLGYRPNRLALGLRSRKTNLIGLMVRTVNHPLQSALNERLIRKLTEKGLEIMLAVMPEFDATARLEALYSHLPEGVIMGPFYQASLNPFLKRIVASGETFIAYGGNDRLPCDHVSYDRAEILQLAVRHLRAAGHERIGCVVGGPHSPLEATHRELVPAAPRHGFFTRYGSYENGFRFASEIALGADWPTAYFLQDEAFALGFLGGIMKRGLRVPDDVAFVVGSRAGLGEFTPVQFTTVYPSLDEMAEEIIALLFQRLRPAATARPRQVWLKPQLVRGDSA